MWTDRQIDSQIDKVMRRSLHWWCHWSRFTESLLLKIETSRSFMTDLVWLFNKFEEFLVNLNEWLIRWSLTQLNDFNHLFILADQRTSSNLLFILSESAHERRKMSAAARTQVTKSKSIENWRTTSRSTQRNQCRLFHFACNEEAFI